MEKRAARNPTGDAEKSGPVLTVVRTARALALPSQFLMG